MTQKIFDTFLPNDVFNEIQSVVSNVNFPWFFEQYVANKEDVSDVVFTHFFYSNYTINSPYFETIMRPFVDLIKPKAIIRARANLTIGQNKFIEHGRHLDYPYPHKMMIFYLNTCNGFTKLDGDNKVDCVANRALFLDGVVEHNSTNCTDDKKRFVLTMNYF